MIEAAKLHQKRLFVVLNSKTTRTRIHDMEQLILSAAAQN